VLEAIRFLCAVVSSMTVCWLVVHAFLRVAWTLPVDRGRRHRQTADRSIGHAFAAVSLSWLTRVVILGMSGRSWTMEPTGMRCIPSFPTSSQIQAGVLVFATPVLAFIITKTGYLNDSVRVDFAKAYGASLVTLTILLIWIGVLASVLPNERFGCS
jgi:hypothetical protein